MNNPNPFIPQGSLLDQKNKKRARVKVAVYSIFAINLLVIAPLLIQGCGNKKEATADVPPPTLPAADTNVVDTNVATQLPSTSNTASAVVSNTPPPYQPPVQQPVPPPVEAASAKEYVVAKGDSYFSIAKKAGVKIKDLEAANPTVPPTKLKVGMKLQVPGSASGVSATGGSPTGASDSGEATYTVKAGDSLTKIAKANGVTVKALRAANDIKANDNKIKVGQKLKLPAKAPVADTTPAPQPTTQSAPVSPQSQPAPGTGTMR
jgi:LysM repeat protein